MADLLVFVVFAALFAMGFNYAMPRVTAYPRFAKYAGTYAGQTAMTAGLVFLLLVGLAYVMSMAGVRGRVGEASV